MSCLNTLRFLYHYSKFKFKYCNARFCTMSLPDSFYETGIHCIPDFFSKTDCDALIQEVDRVLSEYATHVLVDDTHSDHRLFGADRVSQPIQSFWEHPLLQKDTQSYLGYRSFSPNIQGFTLAARLNYTPQNQGSGGGWHRDTIYGKQFKAIVYLTDVDDDNGPFQYISGTHMFDSKLDLIKRYGLTYDQDRLTSEDVLPITEDPRYLLQTLSGKAGTVILVDTSGIHRGKPIESGTRYALTNYYFQKPIFKRNAIPPNMRVEIPLYN
jgi:hypothetical protein